MIKEIDLNNRKVKDPVRFPKIIIPIENKIKLEGISQDKMMIADLTKKMVDLINIS